MFTHDDNNNIDYQFERNNSHFEFVCWIATAIRQKNPRMTTALACSITLRIDKLDLKLLNIVSLN